VIKVDFGLMLVTDRALSGGRTVEKIVEAAVLGGVTIVQLREKEATTREFVVLGRRVAEFFRPRRIPLIINDRVDVALAVLADGVHLGTTDMNAADARSILGPKAIIGLSVENEEQAVAADSLDVDYLGVSPIFATSTKTDTTASWGIEGLWRLRPLVRKPLVAIGGINPQNAARVLEAGADGLAVVSAICSTPDPEAAARELRVIVDCGRAKRGGGI
jgi:thiamine-phosphate pyrophosphorylase